MNLFNEHAAMGLGTLPDYLQAAAALGVAVIATISAKTAINTYNSNIEAKNQTLRQNQEAKAKEIWSNYLRMAFDNARLTEKSWSELTELAKSSGNYEDVEKYEWLTAIMFFAAEEILEISDAPEWSKVVENQVGYYSDYVLGYGVFYNDTYSPKIIDIIDKVKSELKMNPDFYRNLSWRLSRAKAQG